ncbi:transporter [Gammaproteobacteria bacterium]|nr:transporter [Gammaproteobacteria bacterium]
MVSLKPHPGAGIFFGLLAYLFFSSSDALIKILSNKDSIESLSIYQIVATQTLFGLIVILALLPSRGGLSSLKIKSFKVFSARALVAGLGALFAYYSFSQMPMTEVYAIIFCTPMLVTILSVLFLKEIVKIYRWSAVVLGFIGVLIMVRPGFDTLTIAHLAALCAACMGASSTLIMRKWGRFENPLAMLFSVMLGYLITSLPMVAFYYKTPSFNQWLMMAGSGFLLASAQFFIIKAIAITQASSIAPLQYSQMIWGLLFGLLIFKQTPDIYMLIGMIIIIGSSLYTLHREHIHGRTLNAQIKR